MTRLARISGFVPYMIVLFLNAFVDLGHKIVIQNTIFKTLDGQEQIILTAQSVAQRSNSLTIERSCCGVLTEEHVMLPDESFVLGFGGSCCCSTR